MSNLQSQLREQALRKTWQGRPWAYWHSPLRLLAALVSELGELAHLIRFADPIPQGSQEIADEIADIGIFWLRLADQLGIDGLGAVEHKMGQNESRC